ncbi:unnamed protein product [Lactuca virosa]|uniref:Metaxin n=1 Tax=Lactuca virosa TaxID=75947 RepID=A0AAU9M3L6_9ASTR|nr:unnamed protein product [Lactuca virosa]
MDEVIQKERQHLTLVTRKPCFSLPTACPSCLPVYIYLKFANVPFDLCYNLTYPDSDQIPYVDSDTYVAYNNEKGGVIESLKEDNIVNLDLEVQSLPEWVSIVAMINSWLLDAILYELWLLGISKDTAERREEEIYRRATIAYQALSTKLGEESFFFDNRPTSLDAIFLGHALITLYALPETSMLRGKLLEQPNLVLYADKHKAELLDSGSSSSDPSSSSSSSIPKRGPSNWSSKPKSQPPKRERTEEEKNFRRKAKYFLVTQLVAVLVFLSLLGGSDDTEVDADGDDDFDYDN